MSTTPAIQDSKVRGDMFPFLTGLSISPASAGLRTTTEASFSWVASISTALAVNLSPVPAQADSDVRWYRPVQLRSSKNGEARDSADPIARCGKLGSRGGGLQFVAMVSASKNPNHERERKRELVGSCTLPTIQMRDGGRDRTNFRL